LKSTLPTVEVKVANAEGVCEGLEVCGSKAQETTRSQLRRQGTSKGELLLVVVGHGGGHVRDDALEHRTHEVEDEVLGLPFGHTTLQDAVGGVACLHDLVDLVEPDVVGELVHHIIATHCHREVHAGTHESVETLLHPVWHGTLPVRAEEPRGL
jgi:hypothetical protein